MEHYKIPKLLSDSTVSKFVIQIWIKVIDLSSGQYSFHLTSFTKYYEYC